SFSPPRGALGPPPSQRLVHWLDQLFVIQNLVSDLHPRFPAIINAVADEPFAKLPLLVLSFDHSRHSLIGISRSLYNLNAPGSVHSNPKFCVLTRACCTLARQFRVSAFIFATKSS